MDNIEGYSQVIVKGLWFPIEHVEDILIDYTLKLAMIKGGV